MELIDKTALLDSFANENDSLNYRHVKNFPEIKRKRVGRKNRFGEPSRSITVRLPASLFGKLGPDPSTAVGDIVVSHFKREDPPAPTTSGLHYYEANVGVVGADGFQTWRVLASSPADALVRYNKGEGDIVFEEVEVMQLEKVEESDFTEVKVC